MRRINIYIGDIQHHDVQKLAERSGRGFSELIREALDIYLRAHRTEKAKRRKRPAVIRRRPK